MRSPRSVAGLFLGGFVLVHLAWVLTLPPYRGIDEFDHVFRAASLTHGQLRPYDAVVERGRGDYVRVPEETVTDATKICESLPYTGPDNCNPVERLDDDFVTVASAAARYNPAYYAFVSAPARISTGADFVYLARLTSVALCAALWGLALLAALRSARPRGLLLGMALAATPVLTYSGSVVAPNGIEMAGAAACWAAVVAAGTAQDARSGRLLLLVMTAGAVALATVRSMGPVWLLLLAATALLLPGLGTRLALLRRHPRLTALCVATVAAAGLLAVWWTRSAGTNALEASTVDRAVDDPWLEGLVQLPLWLLQTIAAFPNRNEPAPTVVYGAVLVAFLMTLTLAGRASGRRWRLTLVAMTLVWLLPGLLVTRATVEFSGNIWQGRYALPYAIGLPMVLLAWPAARSWGALRRPVVVACAVLYALAVTVSIGGVHRAQLSGSPLSGDPRWVTAPTVALVALAAVGTLLVFAAGLRAPADAEPTAPLDGSATQHVLADQPQTSGRTPAARLRRSDQGAVET